MKMKRSVIVNEEEKMWDFSWQYLRSSQLHAISMARRQLSCSENDRYRISASGAGWLRQYNRRESNTMKWRLAILAGGISLAGGLPSAHRRRSSGQLSGAGYKQSSCGGV